MTEYSALRIGVLLIGVLADIAALLVFIDGAGEMSPSDRAMFETYT